MKNRYFTGNISWYKHLFSQFEQNLNRQLKSPVHRLRKDAIKKLSSSGYPTVKHEAWKHTNVTPISEIDFQLAKSADKSLLKNKDLVKFTFPERVADLLVFINGYYSENLSCINSGVNDIKIVQLKYALNKEEPSLMGYLNRDQGENDLFTLLNTAFLNDGIYIKVPQGKSIDNPLQLLYLSSASNVPIITFPKNIIVLEENSRLRLVETYAGLENSGMYFTNGMTDIIISPNAELDHYKVQMENENGYHVYSGKVRQSRDSRYKMYSISLGGRFIRNTISSVLEAEGGECELNGLYIADGREHVDNHTLIDHAKPHGTSRELYRGVLNDQASGVFNGKIVVRPDAQKTNAIQSNNCILLSKESEINSKPQLEIFADDVKCTHGATIGQLDEHAIFYLLSRGIDRKTAEKMLIYAFANAVLGKISIEPLKHKITALFMEKLSIRGLEKLVNFN